ncbi:MAG: polysaccharide biosynthesis tyrosine autokinase [Verrucomicrobia bacterium]|nr:polysaccharide biosynthesis tyrosine autokinase [Verrucomicrobiota bacterium]
MESPDKQKQEGAGQGYGYGGNYAGYSAAGYGYGDGGGGGSAHRNFQDYLLILRERIWYVVVVFLVVFSSALVFTLGQVKVYRSSATVQIFRSGLKVFDAKEVMETDVKTTEDINTQIKILESGNIVRRVAGRLTGDELKAFLAPYEKASADISYVAEMLTKNRKILQNRLSLIVNITYDHPDRFVAAKVANYFADEYLAYNTSVRVDDSKSAADYLNVNVDEQRKKVELLADALQVYKEKNNMVSLDSRKDIVNETLKAINLEANRTLITLNQAEIRLNQVKEHRAKNIDMLDLPFIANQTNIQQLSQKRSTEQINIAQLKDRYLPKHPKMAEAVNSLAQTERELQKAVDSACAQVESDYQAAVRNNDQVQENLKKQTAESIELDRYAIQYGKLERDWKQAEQILLNISGRAKDTTMAATVSSQTARIVDRASPAAEERPVTPNVPLNLGLGVVGGLGLGLAFAFFVAFIDDRVKSSFDIEGVVGLPLIGIIPQIKRMDQADKAQIVVNNADRQVAEAFLTLHSSLRLKDESKNAKCILTTSTIPGEGKSFTTTNLALTFAAHGERVIVVDCDLRKPNIHKSFRVENLKGVIDVCAGTSTLDDAITRGLQPNFDILTAGGRAKNPTQILNSKGFEQMISDLRKRYDRVFIDTPPLAAVSDALIILPLVDGSIFTIFFNKVRRKAAQFSAKKLLDANVPNFGAVLNGLNLAVSGYYYAQYYDKSYKDYYVVMSKSEDAEKER